MYNNQPAKDCGNNSPSTSPTFLINGPGRPPAPAQTPTEFAQSLIRQSVELNNRLHHLRFRLFGDKDERLPDADVPKEMSLEALVQEAHFRLNEAISQIDAIQNRL